MNEFWCFPLYDVTIECSPCVCGVSHSSVVNNLDEQQANLDSMQETLSSLFNLDQEAFTDVRHVVSCHVMSLNGMKCAWLLVTLCCSCLDVDCVLT